MLRVSLVTIYSCWRNYSFTFNCGNMDESGRLRCLVMMQCWVRTPQSGEVWHCTYHAHHANTVHTVCTGALMHTVHIVHMMHTVLCVPCTFYCALCTVNEQCTMYFAHDAQCEPCTVRSGEIWSKKFEMCCTETDGSLYVLRY